jgi:hypothetical protein
MMTIARRSIDDIHKLNIQLCPTCGMRKLRGNEIECRECRDDRTKADNEATIIR